MDAFVAHCTTNNLVELKQLIRRFKHNGSPLRASEEYDDGLAFACMNGNLDMVKYLVAMSIETGIRFDIYSKYCRAFIYVCMKGHLDVFKYLVSISMDYYGRAFNGNVVDIRMYDAACCNGHIHIIKYLESFVDDSMHSIKWFKSGLEHACISSDVDNVEMIKYLLSISKKYCLPSVIETSILSCFRWASYNGKINTMQYLIKALSMHSPKERHDLHAESDNLFRHACCAGHLDIIKYLLTISYEYSGCIVDIHALNEAGFRMACQEGQFDVIQYLIQVSLEYSGKVIDIHADNDIGFRLACLSGNLNIVKYLIDMSAYSQYGIICIHADEEDGFREACLCGHLDVVKYLVEFADSYGTIGSIYAPRPINIHAHDDLGFRWACMNGHLDVVEYIASLQQFNIESCIDSSFTWACEYGRIEVVKYLVLIAGNIDMHVRESGFIEACANGHVDVATYLLSDDFIADPIDIHFDNDNGYKTAYNNNELNVIRCLVCSSLRSASIINIHVDFHRWDFYRPDKSCKYVTALGSYCLHVDLFLL